jgi:hypothetical protein
VLREGKRGMNGHFVCASVARSCNGARDSIAALQRASSTQSQIGGVPMVLSIHPAVAPLVALIAGILILLMPRILNYVIALYLIVIGLLGLFGNHVF